MKTQVVVDLASYERRVVTHGDLGTALRQAAEDIAGCKRYVQSVRVSSDLLGIWSVEIYVYKALSMTRETIYSEVEDGTPFGSAAFPQMDKEHVDLGEEKHEVD